MTEFARITDVTDGICYHPSHLVPFPTTGKVTGSAATTYIEGLLVARVTDAVTSDCGHPGTIIAASGNIYSEGLRTARKGDPFSGVYVGIITGSASKTGTDNGISGTGGA